MTYQKTFDPQSVRLSEAGDGPTHGRDIRDGSIYVYKPSTVLAVKVALATQRPLLICGPPGSGKSSLAAFVAKTMGWNYFEEVITSRTQARDLQWTFDAVRRLRDAQAGQLYEGLEPYIEPRVLWWAFDPVSAQKRGFVEDFPAHIRAMKPPGVIRNADYPSVVLLDEIDKADPDVPNDLLVALGSQRFFVTEIDRVIKPKHSPLVFITSNDERSLPKAFLRRCVVHTLEPSEAHDLVKIAKAHFPQFNDVHGLFEKIADRVVAMRDRAESNDDPQPSTAEYLDAVRACIEFKVEPGDSPEWQAIRTAVLTKQIG
jgi:MoxR-like ATPase